MKKILVITYYWPPSGGAGVQRWLKFTRYLPEYGVQPVVLTVDPALASGRDPGCRSWTSNRSAPHQNRRIV